MTYQFDIEDATKYGVDESIMLQNIKFWVRTNKANGTNQFDGSTWTYNSAKAFTKLFPFWTEKQIRRVLKSLTDQGVIKSGNYNKSKYNHTTWYALIDENMLFPSEITDIPKREHQSPETVTTVTDSKQHIKNTNKSSTADDFKTFISTTEIMAKRDLYPNELQDLKLLYAENKETMETALYRNKNTIRHPVDFFRRCIEVDNRPKQLGLMIHSFKVGMTA